MGFFEYYNASSTSTFTFTYWQLVCWIRRLSAAPERIRLRISTSTEGKFMPKYSPKSALSVGNPSPTYVIPWASRVHTPNDEHYWPNIADFNLHATCILRPATSVALAAVCWWGEYGIRPTRFRAAVSVLVGPCCPALLKSYRCKCAYCCIFGQTKWWWWWWWCWWYCSGSATLRRSSFELNRENLTHFLFDCFVESLQQICDRGSCEQRESDDRGRPTGSQAYWNRIKYVIDWEY